ncbi:MAG: glycosyltransferase family 2 protein [Elusimicrobia bacterium]|nr:glycosyltransferase family 2 protein [Elusimicrobiota bacterium]
MDPGLKISIIIPTLNRAGFLKEAVDSALAQTYPGLEVIVADNASADNTPAVAAGYINNPRFRYFRNDSNIGMVPNWRKALLEYSSGDWFLILSDDDFLIDPDYIKDAVALIREFPEVVLVYANGYKKTADGDFALDLPFDRVQSGKKIFLTRNNLGQQDFMLCNVLFNKTLALKLKAFSNDHNIACDSELFLKMCLTGDVGFIKKAVSVYRAHENNLIYNYSRDPDILLNHADWFARPYEMAAESGFFTAPELAAWRKRVVLTEAGNIYKRILIYHKSAFFRLTRILIKKSGISPAEFAHINLAILSHWRSKLFAMLRSPFARAGG